MHSLVSKLYPAIAMAILVTAMASTEPAFAEGTNAVRDLPGCTENTLPANDDGSTELVPIGFTPNAFGVPFSALYVNNNGNVTFTGPQSDFTPFDFTTSGDPMIAPFLADVDTQGAPGDGSSEVTYGQDSLEGHAVFCVDWVNVGYYEEQVDKKNSFQLLLIDRGSGDFDLEFNYDKIQWETGDASEGSDGLGGTSAAVGYAAGDGEPSHFYVRDGSFENGALLDGGPKALTAGSLDSGGQLGRYVFHAHSEPATGATLAGEVVDPEHFEPVAEAPVEICLVGGGTCVSRFTNSSGHYVAANLPAGTYEVTAHSPAESEYGDGHATPVAVSGTSFFVRDITLGDPLGGPPEGTTIESVGSSVGGVPTLYWEEASTVTTEGCANGTASYTVTVGESVVQSGSMAESPLGSGNYKATIPALYPHHGNAQVHLEVTDCADPSTVDFGIYIDPSGTVRDAATNEPIAGATVTLFRSADADGPFIQVPDGSAIMSSANRENPDSTDADGHFGWDVIAGYYQVKASAEDCAPVTSDVLAIPPPVTDLNLKLVCHGGDESEGEQETGGNHGSSSGGSGGSGGGASSATSASTQAPSGASPAQGHHKKKKKRSCVRKPHGKHHGHAVKKQGRSREASPSRLLGRKKHGRGPCGKKKHTGKKHRKPHRHAGSASRHG